MKPKKEIWFERSALRGFGSVHWKGPVFIGTVALVGLSAAWVALANADVHPVLAVLGAVVVVSAIIAGNYVCALHTGGDG